MAQQRQLAAIMFTDIEGYSAFMQDDEALALQVREVHRNIFKTKTQQYGGTILQYYGDGTLSIFNSALDAVQCGIDLQLAFRKSKPLIPGKIGLPVRIGIHLGDIIFSDEDIIGDSVNIAARIESLASAGSVFISAKVYDELKNQPDYQVKSMGEFALKNIASPVEVFAMTNEGLVVPDPKQIQGKAKRVTKQEHFLKSIWDQGHIQLIAGYFIGVWGLIQFTDWVVNRYQISPSWVDIMLVFFLTIAPSIFLFVWNRERIHTGKLNSLERYFFPGNLLFSLSLLFFIFTGTDLGSTTKNIQYNNEDGIESSRMVTKPGFRTKLAIHNFTPKEADSQTQWMNYGIHTGITDDITQNEFLTVGFWNNTASLQEMIQQSKENFYTYCLTGTYSVEGEIYKITTKLYRTQSGALAKTHDFKGRDFFALIDTISRVTLKDIGLKNRQINQFVDLPFAEAFTSNLEAYQNQSLFFLNGQIGYLDQAIALDSTFAMASYNKAAVLHGWSSSFLGAEEAIQQSMRHRKRLPEYWQSKVKRLYFQINNQPDKAIALLNMQLELAPENQNTIQTLTHYLHLTGRYDELLAWRKRLIEIDPSSDNMLEMAEAYLLTGQFEEAGRTIQQVLAQNPNDPDAISSQTIYYVLTGQYDQAEALLQKVIAQDPEIEPLIDHYLAAFTYAKSHPQSPESLEKYVGHYRLQARPVDFDISRIKHLLRGKGRTYMGGFFFTPSGPDEFLMGDENILEKWKFISDTTGYVYQIEAFRLERNNRTFFNYLWRQDSLIQRAMGLFALEKNKEALATFKLAFAKNPKHFYLGLYIQHLTFILDPANQSALENLKNYAGKYGPRQIWLENDKVYYTRDGQVSKQRLLPLSPDLFYFLGGYQFQMQVVVENGKVKGTVSWEYDNELGQFVRDDSDYFAFDELED